MCLNLWQETAFTFISKRSPFDAPGIFTFMNYSDFTDGIWYPEGGYHEVIIYYDSFLISADMIAQVLKTLMRISKRYGAVYRLSAPVDKILVSEDGVKLTSGETIDADIVVLNPDIARPQFLLGNESRLDSTAAPEGKDAILVYIFTGGFDREDEVEVLERARNYVIDTIEKQYSLEDLKQCIDFELMNTARTCKKYASFKIASIRL
ncbi:hypothetical protein Clacol_003077 [Clathrus columnatus]|uniref:Uncharacterized protein n=1 Tax=Clathrus columnatus TaxID=1419009 RepID=A0AAV5A5D3_9AGAM|nr:hypothetical protein Clacol_003077 [Clathrus columnatus]